MPQPGLSEEAAPTVETIVVTTDYRIPCPLNQVEHFGFTLHRPQTDYISSSIHAYVPEKTLRFLRKDEPTPSKVSGRPSQFLRNSG